MNNFCIFRLEPVEPSSDPALLKLGCGNAILLILWLPAMGGIAEAAGLGGESGGLSVSCDGASEGAGGCSTLTGLFLKPNAEVPLENQLLFDARAWLRVSD